MEKLLQRLKIMKDAKILSEENMEKVIAMINLLIKDYNISVTEENASILVMHVAMYLGRREKGDIEGLDKDSIDDIKNSEHYIISKDIVEKLESEVFGTISENEKLFIILHMINMLEGV